MIMGDLVHQIIRTRLRELIKHVSVSKKSTIVVLWDWLREYQASTLVHCTHCMGEGLESKAGPWSTSIRHRTSAKSVRGPKEVMGHVASNKRRQ